MGLPATVATRIYEALIHYAPFDLHVKDPYL